MILRQLIIGLLSKSIPNSQILSKSSPNSRILQIYPQLSFFYPNLS